MVQNVNDTPTSKKDADWHDAFIEALSLDPNVSAACLVAGVHRDTAYTHRKTNKDFRHRWKLALEKSVDDLESEARRRAKKGTRKPIFHKGVICGYERQYSDTLMIFLLKAHRPGKYREPTQYNHQQVTTVQQPIVIAYEDVNTANDPAAAGGAEATPQAEAIPSEP